MRIDEKINKYLSEDDRSLNEEKELKAFELEKDEKKGLVAKIARGILKMTDGSKVYKIVMQDGNDRQPVGIFSGNSPEDAIKKARKTLK